jgi:hypothetical protein
MHTIQTSPTQFNYQATVPPAHTLEDYRVVQGEYKGGISKKPMQMLFSGALVLAVFGGMALSVSMYSDHNTAKSSSPAAAQDRSVPMGPASMPNSDIAPAAAAAKVPTPIEDSVAPPPKLETPITVPVMPKVNRAASTSANQNKPVTRAPIKPIAPVTEMIAPLETAPPVPPTPPLVEEKPVVVPPPVIEPTPTPVVPQVDPPKL